MIERHRALPLEAAAARALQDRAAVTELRDEHPLAIVDELEIERYVPPILDPEERSGGLPAASEACPANYLGQSDMEADSVEEAAA